MPVRCVPLRRACRWRHEKASRAVRRIATAVGALAGLLALALILSTSAIATGVIFGVFAGVVTGLAVATIRREFAPRQAGPTYTITHQHIHLHQAQPLDVPQVSEPERQLEAIR